VRIEKGSECLTLATGNIRKTMRMLRPGAQVGFCLLAALTSTVRNANADDVLVVASNEEIRSLVGETDLTVLPIILSGKIKAEYVENSTADQKSEIINRYFNQFFPKNSAQISRFKHVLPCSTKSILYSKQELECNKKLMRFYVPSSDSTNVSRLEEFPFIVLIIEVPCLYKSPNEFEKNEVTDSPDKDDDLEPGEECLHWVCKFVFWNRKSQKTIAYGAITAEACGFGIYRYGEGGPWDKSISDLAQQIYEDTPFSLWDKAKYIENNVREIMGSVPAPGPAMRH
jgi:hypothetical protein